MNYQEFIASLNKKTNQLLNPGAISQIHTALKNNGTERIGLTISEASINISPTIYLEEYYKQYENGWTLDEIAKNIVHLYHEVKFDQSWDVDQVQDFRKVQSKIAYKLINLSQNQELLKDIPHIPFFDLAIVFFIMLDTTEKGAATILITNDILNYWDIPHDTLHQIAAANTPKLLVAEFKPMAVVIQELLHHTPSPSDFEDPYMYVLTNEHRHFGAACILYNHVLEDIANQLGEDFFILPSSIHEVIILPKSKLPDDLVLNEMILEINQTQVSQEEILSDHAYYYDAVENCFMMVAEK